MLQEIKASYPSYKPILYIKSPTELAGWVSSSTKELDYFIWKQFNVTLVDHNLVNCFSGKCKDTIDLLQNGLVDYAGVHSIYQLPESLENITIGPTMFDSECRIMTDRPAQSILEMQSFSKVLAKMDYSFPIFLIFSLAILVPFILKISLRKYSLVNLIWITLSSSVSQLHLPVLPNQSVTRIVLTSMVCIVFISQIILTNFLQTGLIVSIKFDKVETLEQIVERNLRPEILSSSDCLHLMEQSNDFIHRSIVSRWIVIPIQGLSPSQFLKLSENMVIKNNALIAVDIFATFLRRFVCSSLSFKTSKLHLHISKKVDGIKMIKAVAFSSIKNHRIKSLLEKAAYGSFESHNYPLDLVKCYSESLNLIANQVDQRCFNKESTEDEIIQSSLSLNYMFHAFLMLIVSMIISGLIFNFEIFWFYSNCASKCKRNLKKSKLISSPWQ